MESDIFIYRNLITRILLSAAFLALALGIRFLLLRWLSRKEGITAEQRRKWLINSRNTVIFVVLAGLVFIWVNELRTLAVSLIAIAVALVVATKELILCFSGTLLRRASDAYELGDRIDIAGTRGEVIDISFFGTTLREIGPGKAGQQYTGRSIHVPHSLLLGTSIVNESFTGDFQLHLFSIPWKMEDDWQRAEGLLLAAAKEECAAILEQARAHMRKLENRQGLHPPSLEPRISLEIPEPGRINFQVRVPVAADRISRVEQGIIRRFLESSRARENPVGG